MLVNAQLHEGMTGLDVDRVIRTSIASLGVDMDFREIHPNRDRAVMFAPTDGVLKRHEAICIDLGVKYLNYGSDMAHNHSLGKPEAATADLHQRVKDGFHVIMETARPGVECSTVYEKTMDQLRKTKVPILYQMVGHGLGRHVHESPVLTAGDHTAIEEGMVFAFELPMWTKEAGWIQIEENFVIESSGPRWLAPWTLDILVLE